MIFKLSPKIRPAVLILAAVTILFTLILPVCVTAQDGISLSVDEQYMLRLLNEERNINGLPSLEIDPKLELMARQYSREMITYGFFSHTSPVSGELLNRITKVSIPDGWTLAGENLAGAPTVEAAFQGLMESPSHKANILEPKYTRVGIGVIDGGPYGKIFTQEFIAYPEDIAGDTADVPDKSNPTPAVEPDIKSDYDLIAYINNNLLYPGLSVLISQWIAFAK